MIRFCLVLIASLFCEMSFAQSGNQQSDYQINNDSIMMTVILRHQQENLRK